MEDDDFRRKEQSVNNRMKQEIKNNLGTNMSLVSEIQEQFQCLMRMENRHFWVE